MSPSPSAPFDSLDVANVSVLLATDCPPSPLPQKKDMQRRTSRCSMSCLCSCSFLLLFFLFTASIVFFISMRQFRVDPVKAQSFFGRFLIGGHRGVMDPAPENSLEAFKIAKEAGADTIEIDVMLTKDKVAVLMHDDTTERTTDQSLVVASSSFSSLKSLHLKHPMGGLNSSIPSLDDALSFVKANDMGVIIDVKDSSDEMASAICAQIRVHNLYDRAIVSSFSPFVSYAIKKNDPNILTGITFRRWALSTESEDNSVNRHPWYSNWAWSLVDTLTYHSITSFVLPRFLGTEMILANHLDVSPSFVVDARKAGFHVVSWTTNSVAEAAFFRSLEVPLLTDRPDLIVPALRSP